MKVKMALLAVSALVCAYASARPANSFDITFYSDASHTVEVGGGYFTCAGATHTWGQVTQFREESNEQECGEGGYEPPIYNPGDL
jgi:hypothetical protein